MIIYLIVIIFLFSAEKEAPVIHIYDGRGENKELTALSNIHNSPILFMKVLMLIIILLSLFILLLPVSCVFVCVNFVM